METFWTLLYNLAHWEFEILVSFVFLIFESLIFWPIWNRWHKHHLSDDERIERIEKFLNL